MNGKKKILVPLATLLGAAAIAVGSGATFDSTTANTISSVTTGTLSQTNSKADKAILTLTEMKPGDTVNGSLVISNTGSLPADFSLTETSSTNQFADKNLTLAITNSTTGASVYNGTFGGLVDGAKSALGAIAPGAAATYTFSVHLDVNADNTQQGKTATAAYRWDSVQQAGSTTNQ
jgi:spore coat-associated protein N